VNGRLHVLDGFSFSRQLVDARNDGLHHLAHQLEISTIVEDRAMAGNERGHRFFHRSVGISPEQFRIRNQAFFFAAW
jgi:hypothetical protein